MQVDAGPAPTGRFRAWAEGRTGLPDRRRRHAPAGRRGVDAQPGADDRGQLPRQGPPPRLVAGRPVLHGAPGRRRPRLQPPRLAVGGGHRHRSVALLPRLQPVSQGERFDPDGDYVRRWVPELGDGRRHGGRTGRGRCPAARRPATRHPSSTTPTSGPRPCAATPPSRADRRPRFPREIGRPDDRSRGGNPVEDVRRGSGRCPAGGRRAARSRGGPRPRPATAPRAGASPAGGRPGRRRRARPWPGPG